jgi:hypothetical protein
MDLRIGTTEHRSGVVQNHHLRDFWRRSIFDFLDSIDPLRHGASACGATGKPGALPAAAYGACAPLPTLVNCALITSHCSQADALFGSD